MMVNERIAIEHGLKKDEYKKDLYFIKKNS